MFVQVSQRKQKLESSIFKNVKYQPDAALGQNLPTDDLYIDQGKYIIYFNY
jgi:hypothetical protein